MPTTLAAIVIDALDPEALARFWADALGWQVVDEDEDGISLAPAPGVVPTLDIYRVPEPKALKNRLHLDLRADGTTTAAELDRLLALGARQADVGQPDDATWTVLSDPEGNEFCLLHRATHEVAAAGS